MTDWVGVKVKVKEKGTVKETVKNNPLNYQVGGDHYKHFKIQPVEFITVNKLSFLEGCIVKRICRRKPNDLDKIKHEIRLIEKLETKNTKVLKQETEEEEYE